MDQTDFEEPEDDSQDVLPQDEWPWNVTITPPPEYGDEDAANR